jgi:hypothetical protein
MTKRRVKITMEELLLLAHERQMVFSYVTERFGTADLPE